LNSGDRIPRIPEFGKEVFSAQHKDGGFDRQESAASCEAANQRLPSELVVSHGSPGYAAANLCVLSD
jgi:hypothetical protein